MATPLEVRRLAIAAALRAVMAEPLAGPALTSEPAIEPLTFGQRRTPAASGRPSLREALTAEIDWDEPEHLEALDDEFNRSPDDLAGIEAYDDDWESPSVPPLESAGSMSSVASMALFGHA